MRNLLLATDLTVNADRALERAIRLAHRLGVRLHILHVAPSYALPGKGKKTVDFRADARELICSYLAGYADAKDLEITIQIIEGGEAFAEIVSFAQENKAELIVMGMHNKSGFRDLFIGTTVERVIRTGVKPVLMVTDKPKGQYVSVLAGMDFSEGAKAAFSISLQIAPEAKIRLVHAYEFPDTTTGDRIERFVGDVIEKSEADELEKYAGQCKKELNKNKVQPENFSFQTIKGSPAKVLTAEAQRSGADLLAIGVHGRAHFAISKVGGTTEDLLTNPPCDILVAKGTA